MKTRSITRNGRGFAVLVTVCALMATVSLSQSDADHPIFAASERGNVEAVKAIINVNPALIELSDRYGRTPLLYAVCGNHTDLTAYLLSVGASVSTRDNRGWTALHHAAEIGSPEIVELLIRNHADVNAANSLQWTALHQAVLRGRMRVVMTLIEHGADVFASTSQNTTAVNIALENGQLAVRDYLVAHMQEGGKAIRANAYVGQ